MTLSDQFLCQALGHIRRSIGPVCYLLIMLGHVFFDQIWKSLRSRITR